MYITEDEIPQIVQRVEKRLTEEGQKHHMEIAIIKNGGKLEDEWLYINVAPLTAGIRPYDYAEILGSIEKELRQDNIENVLLMPVIPD